MNIEILETRIAPATLLVLNASDELLRIDSTTPGTLPAAVSIGSLGATEDVVGIDFRPATGQLYGLGVDGTTARLLTIDPVSGATAQIGVTFTVSGTSFGFDFNPVADRLRVVSDTDINLSINPVDGVVTTQTALNPGTPNVNSAAYTNSYPGAASTTLYTIDTDGTDRLATINPPSSGTLVGVGDLNVVTDGNVTGFDIGHGKNEAFAALRVGALAKLFTVNLATGAVTEIGNIGTGTVGIRGLAVVLHTWQGDAGTTAWTNGNNWVSGIAPAAGDTLLFPANPTSLSTFNNFASGTVFNSLRFTGAGYAMSNSPMVLQGGIAAHAAGAVSISGSVDLRGSTLGVDQILAENPATDLTIGSLLVDTTAGRGLEFNGAGIVRTFSVETFSNAMAIMVDGPELITTGLYLASGGTIIESGIVTANGGFSLVRIEGGVLRGSGFTGGIQGFGGTIQSGADSLSVNGSFTLNGATTTAFNMPANAGLDPLRVTGTVSLGNAMLNVTLGGSAPGRLTLIDNDAADAVTGTFFNLAEGATVMASGQAYTISYIGGDGNDVVLTKNGGLAPTINGTTVTYTDVDGDDVTVKFSTGTLTAGNFVLRDAGGGRAQLELIDLQGDAGFNGASITITAKRSATLGGDGSVNVGFIDALKVPLGAVTIAGDLGAIDAGDGNGSALKSLSVQSLGTFGFGTGAPDLKSNLDGRLDKLTVRGDMRGASLSVIDTVLTGGQGFDATIGTVTINGSLVGGTNPFSGRIEASRDIASVTIKGDLRGGDGVDSGTVDAGGALGTFSLTGSLIGGQGLRSGKVYSDGFSKSFKVGRDIIGGIGADSGVLDADEDIGTITVGGSVFGGAGADSGGIIVGDELGSLTISGSVFGGSGTASGSLFIDFAKSITIKGSLVGAGEDSATIDIDENVGSLTIGGSVIGGTGDDSAVIESGSDPIGSLKIGGSLLGGAGADSAVISTGGDIGTLSIGGSVQGDGDGSAFIEARNVNSFTIGGSFAGGAGAGSAEIEMDDVGTLKIGVDFVGGSGADSGVIDADSIKTLTIARSIFTGTGADSGRFQIEGDLGTLSVGGGIFGTAANRFLLLVGSDAATAGTPDVVLGKLTVTGSVQHTLILAGFDSTPSGRNGDAQIGSVTVNGDWIASSISAGVRDNTDNILDASFGDADDEAVPAGLGATNDPTLTSRIGSIAIKGQLLGTVAGGDSFGFVAEEIGSVKVGTFSEPLTPGVDAQPLGATGDFVAREDVVGANVVLPVFAGAAGVNVVSDTLATFVDVDGDLVTIKSSKPILDPTDFTSIVSGSGNQLQLIDFTNDGTLGSGVGLTITAAPQDVNGDGKKDGDGFVNIGRIAAPGVDLGAISITGDLGQLDAGDATTLKSPGVKSLTVQSMGEFGTSTQAGGNLQSAITGAIGSLTVKGNIREAEIDVTAATDADAKIPKLTIGGSLMGGADPDSGRLSAGGDIGPVKIGGSIVGGAGDHSALLRSNGKLGAVTINGSLVGGGTAVVGELDAGRISSGGDMGALKILGDVRGGLGELSGTIFAGGKLASLTIGGSLVGGEGDHDTSANQEGQIHSEGDMGAVKITRDIIGGAGDRSAQIFSATKIASVAVGVLKGGAGEDSGGIQSASALGAVTIKGDLVGGAGISSGRVKAFGAVNSFSLTGAIVGGGEDQAGQVEGGSFGGVKIAGSIVGAANFGTGLFASDGAIKSIAVSGSIMGGSAIDTGQIEAGGNIDSATIKGNIRGGDATGAITLFCSGFVSADGRIGKITVGGSLITGTDDSSGNVTNNGAIAAGDDIGKLTVKGSLVGNDTRSVVISARGQAVPAGAKDLAIGSVTVGGGVEFAQILAGYDNNGTDVAESNADAHLGKVSVTGDWIASSLVAGVKNRGLDNLDDLGFDDDNVNFGDSRDVKINELLAAGQAESATITSKIASITIKGQALGTVGGTGHFGFAAQEIGSLKIGAVSYPLLAGISTPDDIIGYAVGATGNLRVHEVA